MIEDFRRQRTFQLNLPWQRRARRVKPVKGSVSLKLRSGLDALFGDAAKKANGSDERVLED